LRNCNILPPLVSFLPLNASLALADTRDTIWNSLLIFLEG
jgi:hypothetical protein